MVILLRTCNACRRPRSSFVYNYNGPRLGPTQCRHFINPYMDGRNDSLRLKIKPSLSISMRNHGTTCERDSLQPLEARPIWKRRQWVKERGTEQISVSAVSYKRERTFRCRARQPRRRPIILRVQDLFSQRGPPWFGRYLTGQNTAMLVFI
jgi:hypothetical protein